MQHVSESSSDPSPIEAVDNRGDGRMVIPMTRRRVILGRVWGMKVELVEVAEDAAIGQGPELWLRVVSCHPLGPGDYKIGFQKFADTERNELIEQIHWNAGYKFYVDLWAEDDEEREDNGFEQWWVFTRKEMNIGHNLD